MNLKLIVVDSLTFNSIESVIDKNVRYDVLTDKVDCCLVFNLRFYGKRD